MSSVKSENVTDARFHLLFNINLLAPAAHHSSGCEASGRRGQHPGEISGPIFTKSLYIAQDFFNSSSLLFFLFKVHFISFDRFKIEGTWPCGRGVEASCESKTLTGLCGFIGGFFILWF